MGGRGWAGWSGVKGGKWDNCNTIINKYIKNVKKENNNFINFIKASFTDCSGSFEKELTSSSLDLC